jgi:hypothetical protein
MQTSVKTDTKFPIIFNSLPLPQKQVKQSIKHYGIIFYLQIFADLRKTDQRRRMQNAGKREEQ